jgi:hypothetical protein
MSDAFTAKVVDPALRCLMTAYTEAGWTNERA